MLTCALCAVVFGVFSVYAELRSEQLQRRMLMASYYGDLKVLRRCTAEGANINHRDAYGWTALHWAAARGHHSVVRYLLAEGGKVDAKTKWGDESIASKVGPQMLQSAYESEKAKIDDIPISVLGHGGVTPLMLAVAGGHSGVVRALLEAGANTDLVDDFGNSSISRANKLGNSRLRRLVIRYSRQR